MKKTILKTSIIALIGLSQSSFSQENVLDKELDQLENYFDSINLDDKKENEGSSSKEKKSVTGVKTNKEEKTEDNFFSGLVEKVVTTSKEKIETMVKEKETPKTVKITPSQGSIFMRNIPEGTRFTVKEDFVVHPNNKYIIFHNGSRVNYNPNNLTPYTTFCLIQLTNSGKARILKKGREFIVTSNSTTSSDYVSDEGLDVRVNLSTIGSNLASMRSLQCYKGERTTDDNYPLRIEDLIKQTGGSFSVEFPAYEEI